MTDILIVDDELGIRNILSEILGEQGYRVATAANVAEAKKAVTGRHYDLILLDIWMPDGDGLTLLREWKYSGALTFPVIVMARFTRSRQTCNRGWRHRLYRKTYFSEAASQWNQEWFS